MRAYPPSADLPDRSRGRRFPRVFPHLRWSAGWFCAIVEHVFDDDGVVLLTREESRAFEVAWLETEYGRPLPEPADFVRDDRERFLDARIQLLNAGAAELEGAVAAGKRMARDEAARARALAAFVRARPAALFDRAPGERGAASTASRAARPSALTEVSEWAVDEAAATLRISGRAASMLLVDAVTLVEGLPTTLAALAAGDLSPQHARVMVEIVGPVTDPGTRAQIEADVLPRAVAGQAPTALRASARRAVAKRDAAAAADRLAAAVRDRHVRLDARDDGMSTLTALLSGPVARACREALSGYAKACEFDENGDRDPRSHQERMADCFADLILRPHADHPVVRILLTLIAGVDTVTGHGPGADAPGELDGDPVSAAQVRELAYQFGLLSRPEGSTGREPEAGRNAGESDADDSSPGTSSAEIHEPAGAEARLVSLRQAELAAAGELLAMLATGQDSGGGDATTSAAGEALTRLLDARRLLDTTLAERPRIAIVDALSGTLLSLTDSTEMRTAATTGRGLGPPAGTDAYRPTDSLHRFVRLRDRRCRFPGCRARARCCDLDHQLPHPHGDTAHDNLACLCEHHHRLSHQAPGWRLSRDPDGGLRWTLPGGRTITTYPPPFGTDDASVSVLPPPRTGRQRYADALSALANSRPGGSPADIPF